MLRIYLLGPFRVERDGQVIPQRAWARPKDRAVLKLLALNRGHLVPQEHLLDTLWPELGAASAAKSLYVAISRLRKLLGPPPLIRREPAGYVLAPTDAVWIDVEEFRRLLDHAREWRRRSAFGPAAAAYRAAVALYRGDLCEDDPYAEWALRPREQLRESQLALLEEGAECLVQIGAPVEAIELCTRGLAQDRTREGLYLQLMRTHAAAGHLAEALQVYEQCRKALAEELGVSPGPAISATHVDVLRGTHSAEVPLSSGPTARGRAVATEPRASTPRATRDVSGRLNLPCVGREHELAYLTSRLDMAQAGQGQIVLLHGEPGIGKSRVLEELAHVAASRGLRQLSARCYELERDLPYAPLVDALGTFLMTQADPAEVLPALGQWGPRLSMLLPSLRDVMPDLPRPQPVRPDAERSALVAGLTHLLISLARGNCLLLVVDDLHWADASTVQWLHYLTRRLVGVPVLVVGAYRSNDLGPDHPLQQLLESLAGDPNVPAPRELRCLEVEHVAALLPLVSGSEARGRALAERLHRETDGQPLFLSETLRTLIETGILRLDEQNGWQETGATLPDPERRLPLPPTLREAILWRVRRLNESERRVLMTAAVLARGFSPELLERMTDMTSDAVLDALDALVGRQLVRLSPAGSGFDFRHDLIQQAVYADLSPDRRRVLHARAAAALEEGRGKGAPPVQEIDGELAHHWQQAEQWSPAVRYAVLAGDHARAAFAPREALAHFQRAAAIADLHQDLLEPSDRAGLLERLGRAHADLGEFDAAIRQFEALRDLARALHNQLLDGRALLALADAHYWRHDFEPAEHLATEALRRAEELGDRGLRAGSLVTAAGVAMARGRTTQAEQHCGAVLALTGERPPAEGGEEPLLAGARLNALGWLGLLRELQGDHERALPAIEGSLQLGRALHNPFLTGRSRFALGMSLGNRGHYEDALATLLEAFRLAEEGGDRYFWPRLPNTIGWVYSELGDLRQATEWNQRSIALARQTGWLEAEANALVNLGSDALRGGQHAQAREHFEHAAALIDRDHWFTWRYRMRLLVGLGELALLERAPEQALAFAQQALAVAEPTGSRKHAGRARLLRGRALLAVGVPPTEVLAPLEQAQALARASGHPPLLWSSAHELAALHTRLGHEAEAAACRAVARTAVGAVADSIDDVLLRRSFIAADPVQRVLNNA